MPYLVVLDSLCLFSHHFELVISDGLKMFWVFFCRSKMATSADKKKFNMCHLYGPLTNKHFCVNWKLKLASISEYSSMQNPIDNSEPKFLWWKIWRHWYLTSDNVYNMSSIIFDAHDFKSSLSSVVAVILLFFITVQMKQLSWFFFSFFFFNTKNCGYWLFYI
jgi:hypothetical protein